MKECAAQFSQRTKVPVSVVGGPEKEWIAAAQRDADLVFGGAEYMLFAYSDLGGGGKQVDQLRPRGISWIWWLVGLGLLALFAFGYLRGLK